MASQKRKQYQMRSFKRIEFFMLIGFAFIFSMKGDLEKALMMLYIPKGISIRKEPNRKDQFVSVVFRPIFGITAKQSMVVT
jgi:hypothetical protein